jgi:hypothetical protein
MGMEVSPEAATTRGMRIRIGLFEAMRNVQGRDKRRFQLTLKPPFYVQLTKYAVRLKTR